MVRRGIGSERADTVTVSVVKLHETEKAILVSSSGRSEDGVWLPKSQVDAQPNDLNPGILEVELPEWLAQDKGLI